MGQRWPSLTQELLAASLLCVRDTMVSQTQPLPSESLLSTGDRETKASLLSRGDYDNDHQQRIGRTVCVRLRGRPEHETGNK